MNIPTAGNAWALGWRRKGYFWRLWVREVKRPGDSGRMEVIESGFGLMESGPGHERGDLGGWGVPRVTAAGGHVIPSQDSQLFPKLLVTSSGLPEAWRGDETKKAVTRW